MRDPLRWPRGPFGSPRAGISALYRGSAGILLEPAKLSSLAQDAAGAQPVTAPGQPVGLVRDLSGGGRHATQSTSAARPTLVRRPASGVRNRVRPTSEALSQWVSGGSVTVVDNTPGGSTITAAAGSSQHTLISARDAGPANADLTVTLEAKAGTETLLILQPQGATPANRWTYEANLTTGVVTSLGGAGEATNAGAASQSLADGWWKITLRMRPQTTAEVGVALRAFLRTEAMWAASGTEALQIRRVQIESGPAATKYQTVASASDILEAGALDIWALSFDGVDDWMTTASMALAAGGRTVIAALQKRSDASVGTVVETGPDWSTTPGAINLIAPATPGTGDYGSRTRPAANPANLNSASSFAAPHTAVLSLRLATSSHVLRVNGAAVSGPQPDSVSALSAPVNIGARSSGSRFGALDLYGLVVIDRALTDAELTRAEAWAAAKCGVSL